MAVVRFPQVALTDEQLLEALTEAVAAGRMKKLVVACYDSEGKCHVVWSTMSHGDLAFAKLVMDEEITASILYDMNEEQEN